MIKKISIITVNYNNKDGLKKTIDSVVNQTWKDFEFIIIDGNSNDGSKDIIQEYRHSISYALSEPDTGIYNAMNKGIKAANGNYLLFLNSGDILLDSNTLEKANELINGDYDIYYGDIVYDEIAKREIRTFPKKLNFNFFYLHNLSHQASFIKRSLFDDIFYYNEEFKIVSDWEFFIYAICNRNASYHHMNIVICIYDGTGLSSNLNNHKLMHEERSTTIARYFPLFAEDYEKLIELNSKRFKQFAHIKTHKVAWEILKGLMSLILLFLPKQKN